MVWNCPYHSFHEITILVFFFFKEGIKDITRTPVIHPIRVDQEIAAEFIGDDFISSGA